MNLVLFTLIIYVYTCYLWFIITYCIVLLPVVMTALLINERKITQGDYKLILKNNSQIVI